MVGKITGRYVWKIRRGQRLQVEAGTARAKLQLTCFRDVFQADLRAIGQFPNYVVEHVCGNRSGSRPYDVGCNMLDDLEIEVCAFQADFAVLGRNKNVG